MASTTKPAPATPSFEGSGYEVIRARREAQGTALAAQIGGPRSRGDEVEKGILRARVQDGAAPPNVEVKVPASTTSSGEPHRPFTARPAGVRREDE